MRYKRAKVKCLDAWRGKVLRFYSQPKCQLFVLGREILVFDQLSGKLAKMLVFWYLINSPRKIRSDSGQIWTFFVIFLYFCWDGQKSKHLRITKNLYKSQHECAATSEQQAMRLDESPLMGCQDFTNLECRDVFMWNVLSTQRCLSAFCGISEPLSLLLLSRPSWHPPPHWHLCFAPTKR